MYDEETRNKRLPHWAARELANLISSISEDRFCAGWCSSIEHTVWEAVQDPQSSFISEDERNHLKLLSKECNGWVYWEHYEGETFLWISEWEKFHKSYLERMASYVK